LLVEQEVQLENKHVNRENPEQQTQASLVDRFNRRISYLRISVTDRCDLRCICCMSEYMEFVPRSQLLTLEELYRVGKSFVEMGVRTIRITGGEPLTRRGVMQLFKSLGELDGLEDLTLTTNGSDTRIGFISPHSHKFYDHCNRIRLTAEGRLLLCLGQEHSMDLRRMVRANPLDDMPLRQAIIDAMEIKPKGHEFDLRAKPVLFHHMNVTGG
jgi:molybdenum cofactor biosynthesis enzyme MoaA